MADPLSIAAGAAGIISLGIESCKLIVKYCDDIRGADDQIESIALKAGGLLSTLQQVEILLKETDGIHPKIASDIREKVLQNETWITKINERVARLSMATSSNGLSDKLRSTAKKTAYPLKKDSLLSTVEILQALQMNLHTALLTLQIQHASALSNQTELIERVESLVLVRTGQLGLDMGRMELAIRNSSTASQQQQVSKTQEEYSMPCMCSNNVTPFGHEMAIRRKCPRHKHSTHIKTQSKCFTFTSSWFGFSIEAVMSISRRANGLSITPTLNFRPVVPDDSPAFKLVRRSLRQDMTPEETAGHFNRVVQELQRLFDQGRATPFDRTKNGHTLLHAAAFRYSFYDLEKPVWNLMTYLAEAGCPINETDIHGNLAINAIIDFPDDREIYASRFLTLGAVLADSSLQELNGTKTVKHLWSKNREAFSVSDVTEAVLSHSENMLKHYLALMRSDEQKIYELYKLCLHWADGIRILHEAGGEIPTSKKNHLLSTAVTADLTEVAQALVDIGAVAASRLIALSSSGQMEDFLIQDLVSNGKNLLTLAKALPAHVQIRLELQNGHLPDRKARCIVLELESRGFPIDPGFKHYNEKPVYCESNLQPDQMERLYQAGFRDVDAPDSRGYTPLMQPRHYYSSFDNLRITIERTRWLIDKGASLDVICESNKLPAHNVVILNIVVAMLRFLAGDPHFGDPPAEGWDTKLAEIYSRLTMQNSFFQNLLGSESSNEVQCFCSVPKSSLLSMALFFATNIAFSPWFENKTNTTVRKSLGTVYEAFLTTMQIGPPTADDIIRLLTFTDLELTHTCYRIEIDRRVRALNPVVGVYPATLV